MRNIVLTGGAGFIGSHIADHLFEAFPDTTLTIIDKMTYAAHVGNVSHLICDSRVRLEVGDICDFAFCSRFTKDADLVIHAAAESHVDNSFGNSLPFTMSNVYGTHVIMEACRFHGVPKIIHVSTDEVYGEVLEGECDESTQLNPTNPYSASKAGAEMIIRGYLNCYKMPIVTVRANNVFGVRQFPEKLIPKFSLYLLNDRKLPLHGDGSNRRHFLAAQDFARAIEMLMTKGVNGETYNIGSEEEYTNLQVAGLLCDALGKDVKSAVTFVEDRPFNDRRYSIDSSRVRALGWIPTRSLQNEIGEIVQWYRSNADRYRYVMGE